MSNYNYSDISAEGIKNVILSNGFVVSKAWNRKRLIEECEMLINRDDIDIIDLILEESGE